MLHEIYYVSVKITYKPTLFILLNIKLKLKKIHILIMNYGTTE